ncbi:nucleoside-diphosphate sugar epimerase [bacterium]|nr:MAG: nucleoside-diphosphate sugar epimerase [bacterium]
MKMLVTGGAGFVGSHVAEYFLKKGWEVVIYDNLSRGELLKKEIRHLDYNWRYLKENFDRVTFFKEDIRDMKRLMEAMEGVQVIVHAAAQTAVTVSVEDPHPDFTVNALGTFNVLEAARKLGLKPTVIYCSTNKVYGDNVNKIKVIEGDKRYSFPEEYKLGIPEDFPVDLCEHTPYGCSKLTGDISMQDYAHLYGFKVGVFRMSCIYGTRQFGVEDQGWVAHFVISTLLDRPITIYGDGKQVRDVLYVEDLVRAFEKFIESDVSHGVYNTGGGPDNTLSLLELLDMLEKLTGKRTEVRFSDWRPSDQRVYISRIEKIKEELGWEPCISPEEGVKRLVEWVEENKNLFE